MTLTQNSTVLLLDGAYSRQECIPVNYGIDETPSLVSIESASALQTLSRLACSFFMEGLGDPAVINSVSVFLIQATYQAASTLIRITEGNPDTKMMQGIEAIKQHLEELRARWRVAGMSSSRKQMFV